MSEISEQEIKEHVFNAGQGDFREDHTGLFAKIWDAWGDMQTSTRRLIKEKPSESRLLFFVLMSDLMFFLSWSIKTIVSPNSIAESALPDNIALLLVGALLLRTGSVYIFAILVGLFLKMLGGTGTLKDTRCGIFWGSFVAAPFGLLAALLAMAMHSMEGVFPFIKNETVGLAPLWLGLLPFVWYVSAGATEAHGFKKVFPLFAGLALLCVVGLLIAMYLQANGVF